MSNMRDMGPIGLPKWRWYVFGGRGKPWMLSAIDVCFDPPWWYRLYTRIRFGSQWERL